MFLHTNTPPELRTRTSHALRTCSSASYGVRMNKILIPLLTLPLLFGAVPAAQAACQAADQSNCNGASNDGSGVDVWGNNDSESSSTTDGGTTTGGGSSTPGGTTKTGGTPAQGSKGSTKPLSAAQTAFFAAKRELKANEPTCASYGTCKPASPGKVTTTSGTSTGGTTTKKAPVTITRTVTTTDIARFVPRAPGAFSEPAVWTVAKVPTNFVLRVEPHIVTGKLLGLNAEVKFTPIGSRWTHSDGAVVDAPTIGATWAALGQAEFTPTATSHVYATMGSYTIGTAVIYRAEYRVGTSDWKPVSGTLTVAGPPLHLIAYGSRTALVERTCLQGNGPGC